MSPPPEDVDVLKVGPPQLVFGQELADRVVVLHNEGFTRSYGLFNRMSLYLSLLRCPTNPVW